MIIATHIDLLATANGNSASPFLLMTLASIGLLWLLPVVCRRHVAKVGTYAHELSHGVVSHLTGGEFHRFHITDDGGLCVTCGGNPKAVAAAGYIGTVVLGTIFLARSAQADHLTVTLQILAVLLAFSTLKAGDTHTAAVGLIVAAVLELCCTLFPGTLATCFLLNLMGVILVWQGFRALMVLWQLSASGSPVRTDAQAMAAWAGRSARFWTVVFGGIALILFILILRVTVLVIA